MGANGNGGAAGKLAASMRATIGAQRISQRRDTKAEYKFTNNILDTVYGNLGSTIKGGTALMTAEQNRQLGALARLKQNQAAGSRAVTKQAAAAIRGSFGSAIEGAASGGLTTTKVAGKAGTVTTSGLVKGAGIVGAANIAQMKTMQQGVKLAEAGAAGLAADALAYRAKNDAALIAQEKLDLQKQMLAAKLDIQNYQDKYLIDHGIAVGKKGGGNTADQLIRSGSSIAVDAADTWRASVDADGKHVAVDIGQAGVDYAKAQGYLNADGTVNITDPQVQLYMTTLRYLQTDPHGAFIATAYRAAVTDLYQNTPGWDKWGAAALDAGVSALKVASANAAKTAADAAAAAGAAASPFDPNRELSNLGKFQWNDIYSWTDYGGALIHDAATAHLFH